MNEEALLLDIKNKRITVTSRYIDDRKAHLTCPSVHHGRNIKSLILSENWQFKYSQTLYQRQPNMRNFSGHLQESQAITPHGFPEATFHKEIHCMQSLINNTCSFMLSLKIP